MFANSMTIFETIFLSSAFLKKLLGETTIPPYTPLAGDPDEMWVAIRCSLKTTYAHFISHGTASNHSRLFLKLQANQSGAAR